MLKKFHYSTQVSSVSDDVFHPPVILLTITPHNNNTNNNSIQIKKQPPAKRTFSLLLYLLYRFFHQLGRLLSLQMEMGDIFMHGTDTDFIVGWKEYRN